MRKPDFIIGREDDPYMRRWWVIPRNPFFNIYLHQILRSDDDRALHDHPWWNISVILKGFYFEHTPAGVKLRKARSVTLRRAGAAHRLEVFEPCWSLFITGPIIRKWGFHCPRGWVYWRDFVDDRDTGKVGRGCGEHA